MKRFLLLLLAFLIVMLGLLLIFRFQFRNVPDAGLNDQNYGPEVWDVTYFNKNDETATVRYEGGYLNAYLTYHATTRAHDFEAVTLSATTTASGTKYENPELGLVLYEKSGGIMLYENDILIFESVPQTVPISDEEAIKSLSANSWKWYETVLPSGDIVTPSRSGAFVLRFSSDKTMRGSTDCNGFSGSYSVSGWNLSFGSMMSTLMFCEGSQETEYVTALAQTGSFAFNKEGSLVLTLGQEQGIMTFVVQQE